MASSDNSPEARQRRFIQATNEHFGLNSTDTRTERIATLVPGNDNVADPTIVGSLPYSDTVDTTDATIEGGDPAFSCGFQVGNTVWYSYTPSTPAQLVINTIGSDFDTVLAVFNASTLEVVGCNDDDSGLQSGLILDLGATEYLIGVGGYNANSGSMTINISDVGPFTSCAAVDVPQVECEALVNLYNATGGGSWFDNLGWLSTNLVCAWSGIDCYGGNVHVIDLFDNNLAGTLNVNLSALSSVWWLDLGYNSLDGDMSTVINNLPTSIEYLLLGSNSFTGTIPASTASFPLSILNVGDNSLEGDLTTILGYLQTGSLYDLALYFNNFTGTIPAGISSFTSLEYLDVTSNALTGDLSTIIPNMPTSMYGLNLGGNGFTGSIPDEIANMASLGALQVQYNSGMSGTISYNITLLDLYAASFEGTSLCEPPNPGYGVWKATVTYYYPSSCGSYLFKDDFETNDLSLWSSYNDGGGFLYTCAQAAMNGSNYGACVARGTNDNRKQLIDQTPNNETAFNARFNFDINGLSMGLGEPVRIVQFKMLAERPVFLVMQRFSDGYKIQLNVKEDDLSKTKTAWILLTDAPHTIEVDWAAASSDGANDGYAALYLDDVLAEALTGLDNDTFNVTSFRMGFTSRLAGKAITGIFFVDDVSTSPDVHLGLP